MTEAQEIRAPMYRLAARITIYYAVIAVAVYALVMLVPSATSVLPFGGIESVAAHDPAIDEINAALRNQPYDSRAAVAARLADSRFAGALRLLLAMLSTLILMLPVAWVYQCIHYSGEQDHSLDETALILPTVVAGIVTVVQHSLALAFSLAGIVAGVRFRRTLSDTFDTLFIFVAIGVGIAAGVAAIEIAAVMTVMFNYSTLAVCVFGDGLETQHAADRRRQKRARARRAADDSKKG